MELHGGSYHIDGVATCLTLNPMGKVIILCGSFILHVFCTRSKILSVIRTYLVITDGIIIEYVIKQLNYSNTLVRSSVGLL